MLDFRLEVQVTWDRENGSERGSPGVETKARA